MRVFKKINYEEKKKKKKQNQTNQVLNSDLARRV